MGKEKDLSDWYKNQPKKTLQEVFAEHFARDDIEGAKKWYLKWRTQDEQIVKGHENEATYTLRAMAGHISDYLEGFTGDEPESYNGKGLSSNYTNTKYGSEIYFGD